MSEPRRAYPVPPAAPALSHGWQPCDRCHCAAAQFKVIVRADEQLFLFFCGHDYRAQEIIFAELGYKVEAYQQ